MTQVYFVKNWASDRYSMKKNKSHINPDEKTLTCTKCKKKFKVNTTAIVNAKISLTRLVDENQELYVVPCTNCGAPNKLILPKTVSKDL